MKIEYFMDEKDFLTHQLFLASQNKNINNTRNKNRLISGGLFVIIGLFLLIINLNLAAIIVIMVGLVIYILYPLWDKSKITKHYKEAIQKNYQHRIGTMGRITFNKQFIISSQDKAKEMRIKTSEVQDFYEIPQMLLVRLKNGQSFILPADKIKEYEELKSYLKELATQLNIEYLQDEQWKW